MFLEVIEATLHAFVVEIAADLFQLLVAGACLMLIAVGVVTYFQVPLVLGSCLCIANLRWVLSCLMLNSCVCYTVILNAFML
jgi:hypothetical protein